MVENLGKKLTQDYANLSSTEILAAHTVNFQAFFFFWVSVVYLSFYGTFLGSVLQVYIFHKLNNPHVTRP